jgi:hypothetical protein
MECSNSCWYRIGKPRRGKKYHYNKQLMQTVHYPFKECSLINTYTICFEFRISIFAQRAYLCVLYGSHSKQRLFP